MKNMIVKTVVAGMVAAVTGTAMAEGEVPATEVGITEDFASAYVFRGSTFNDEAVFQPGVEVTGLGLPEGAGSLTIGVWGNYDIGDYGGVLKSSEFSEVDWYASYSLPSLVDGLDLFVGWTEYTYPNGGVSDKEASIGVGFDAAGAALGATAYLGVGGGINGNSYYELSAGYDLELSEELGASIGGSAGYLHTPAGEDGWNDGSLSAALSYSVCENWSVGASLAYIAQLDDDVLVDVEDGGTYDVDMVGMLSLAGSF
ncbi:MAG: TorF family putative porin [Verrucomicrobiota bacterium]